MSVVTFAEIVASDVEGFETSKSLQWSHGGAVDLDDITSIGMFQPAARFNQAQFNIRFKKSEMQCVESSNTTAIRKLQAGLTKLWQVNANRDLRIQPIDLLNKEA